MNKNKIKMSTHCLEVICDRNDSQTQEALMDIFPLHVNRIKTSYKMSPHHIPEVLEKLRGLTKDNITTAPPAVQKHYFREMAYREQIAELLCNGPKGDPVVNKYLTLKPHQQLAREIARYADKFGFFYDTRTGKTPLSIAIILDDLKENPKHKWLVICPLILVENAWVEDTDKFIPYIKTINTHARTKKKRLEAINTEGSIYITNTESFVLYKEYFEKTGFTGCIVDESSDMKRYTSSRSEAIVEFAQHLDRFYLLSGTPAPNNESEYFAQIRAIDYYGVHASFNQFKKYFFVNLSFNPQYEKLHLRPDRMDEFTTWLSKYSLYVDKEDVLTTPGRTFHEVYFDMPPELKKHYSKMKNKLYVELGNDIDILAPSTATKLNKLRQIAAGFILDTEAKKENALYEDSDRVEKYTLSDYRIKELDKLLKHIGDKPVIIWANFREEFAMLEKLLGDECLSVHGGVSYANKNIAIQRFKQGTLKYLLANPASADKGLTLTISHTAIYYSLNWSYELFKQSYERIYGDISKQPEHCNYYIMMANNSIDKILYHDVLQGKGDASSAILNHLKGGL